MEPDGNGFNGVNFSKSNLTGKGELENFEVSFDQQVNAIVQTGCDRLLVGGLFDEADGIPRRGLAMVQTTNSGSVDENFDAGLNGGVWSLLRDDENDTVFIGGEFTQIFNQSRNRVAKFDSSLSSWNPGSNGVPVAMELDGLGGLYVAGTFTQFGGLTAAQNRQDDGKRSSGCRRRFQSGFGRPHPVGVRKFLIPDSWLRGVLLPLEA